MADMTTTTTAAPARPGGRRHAVLAVALLLALAAGTGAAVAVLYRPSTGRVELLATRAASAPGAISAVELGGPAGTAQLDVPTTSVAEAPQPTDLGGFDVPTGDYREIAVRAGGRTLRAPLSLHVGAGGLTPVLVSLGGGTLTAYAGNDGVNLGLLVAGGRAAPVPDVAFSDQAGRTVHLGGRPTIVAAFETHCHESCPLYTAVLADLARTLQARGWASRVAIAEVTMDPERDTPATLAAYRRLTGASWELLTAQPAALRVFWASLHASYRQVPYQGTPPTDWLTGRPEAYDVTHDALAAVLDAQGIARFVLAGDPRLGHGLSAPLGALLSPEAAARPASAGAWTLTDLLNRVDLLLGEPSEQDRRPEAAVRAGAPAPGFSLAGLDTGRVALADELGHPVIVSFWATWCGPCRRELPLLSGAAAAHPGLVVLAADQGEDAATVRSFLHGIAGAGRLRVLLDGDRAVGAAYAVAGLPVSVAVDAGGTVRAVHVGELTAASLDWMLASIGA